MKALREFRDGVRDQFGGCFPSKAESRALSVTGYPGQIHSPAPVRVPATAPALVPSRVPGRMPSTRVRENPVWRERITQTPDGQWCIPGVGEFANKVAYSFEDGTIPAGLQINVEKIGTHVRGSNTFCTQYETGNVAVANGFLNLTIPGGQNIRQQGYTCNCAAVETVEDKIQYASVRTTAVFSTVPGSCHGLFFYCNDNNEIDIEYLTDPSSSGNPGNGAPPDVNFTNQPLTPDVDATQASVPAPVDVTIPHEYRTDWIEGKTMFYIDCKLVATMTDNVTEQPGKWMWNNWCNGNPYWSCGPPQEDNVLQIQSITMYYNLAE